MDHLNVGILTVSDRCYSKEMEDQSGPFIEKFILENDHINKKLSSDISIKKVIVDDDEDKIEKQLLQWIDQDKMDLIITTGGTGFTKRDVTPEATKRVIQKEANGIVIAMMIESLKKTPFAMLSRGVAGIRNETLVINLPGSVKACKENLEAIVEALPHGILQLKGKEGHLKK